MNGAVVQAVVAEANAQGSREPLISRTLILKITSERGVPKSAAREAWHALIDARVLQALGGLDEDGWPVRAEVRPFRLARDYWPPQPAPTQEVPPPRRSLLPPRPAERRSVGWRLRLRRMLGAVALPLPGWPLPDCRDALMVGGMGRPAGAR